MVDQRLLEQGVVSFEVDTLLEIADEPRCEADQLHAALETLVRDDVVFGERRRLLCFVHAQLDFVVSVEFRVN